MKRTILLVLLAVVGFYVAWPAFSAYQLSQGLKSRDPALVASKIDFAALRSSLRPTVERETEKAVDDALTKSGGLGAQLGPQLKAQFMPQIVDHALATFVTPEILIRLYAEGGDIKDSISRIVAEQAGKLGGATGPTGAGGLGDVLSGALGADKGLGGLFGKKKNEAPSPVRTVTTAETKTAKGGEAPAYGISNIKRLGFDGPLGLVLGVAKDASAREPDVTAHMAFTGLDWKLVGLVPKAR